MVGMFFGDGAHTRIEIIHGFVSSAGKVRVRFGAANMRQVFVSNQPLCR